MTEHLVYNENEIQNFYRVYPISVAVPYRTETLLFKNTITFRRGALYLQRYIEKYAVTSFVTLNCNGKYTVKPTVTVNIFTAS
jgi:hypothetical protein